MKGGVENTGCVLTHYSPPRAVEPLGAEGGRALGVSGQPLGAEEAGGAHHLAQHGLLAGGLAAAVMSPQARRTALRPFVLHSKEEEEEEEEEGDDDDMYVGMGE